MRVGGVSATLGPIYGLTAKGVPLVDPEDGTCLERIAHSAYGRGVPDAGPKAQAVGLWPNWGADERNDRPLWCQPSKGRLTTRPGARRDRSIADSPRTA